MSDGHLGVECLGLCSLTLQTTGLSIAPSALSSAVLHSHNHRDDRATIAWISLWLHVTTFPFYFCLLLSMDVKFKKDTGSYLFFKLLILKVWEYGCTQHDLVKCC